MFKSECLRDETLPAACGRTVLVRRASALKTPEQIEGDPMSATPARGANATAPVAAPEPARVETLESRRLLTVTLAGGVLTIDGSDSSDFIRVNGRDDQIVVRDSTSGRFSFDEDEIDQVLIRLGSGNDRARLTNVEVPSRIEGDAGADILTGGDEDDV